MKVFDKLLRLPAINATDIIIAGIHATSEAVESKVSWIVLKKTPNELTHPPMTRKWIIAAPAVKRTGLIINNAINMILFEFYAIFTSHVKITTVCIVCLFLIT